MGCTCGLVFGPWSLNEGAEQHSRRLANASALRDLLASHASRIPGIITLDSYENVHREEFPRLVLELDAFTSESFEFEDDVLYELWPESIPGPSRFVEVFPPKKLKKKDIGGIAPEVFSYIEDFSGKAWDEVPNAVYAGHGDAFIMMDVETLQYLFPGYLLYCLSDRESSGSSTEWSLQCFAGAEKIVQLFELFSHEQCAVAIQAMNFFMAGEDIDSENHGKWQQIRATIPGFGG